MVVSHTKIAAFVQDSLEHYYYRERYLVHGRCERRAVAVVPVCSAAISAVCRSSAGFVLGSVIVTIDTSDDQAASFSPGLVKMITA